MLWNTARNVIEMVIMLGPPGCEKSTSLHALAGKLDESLKVKGNIIYNGHQLDEFVPQKTSGYINQYDLHIGEMTTKETIEFLADYQGFGTIYGPMQ
eukprot:Gb_19768 [translate_table: standard]